MKTKKRKQKFSKKDEQVFLKDFFIYLETIKMLTSIGIDDELLNFIKCHFNHEILSECSEYGDDLFNLNLLEFINQEKCFLCFIKLDVDDYLERMLIYMDELKQAA
jgi:hypothetical protein